MSYIASKPYNIIALTETWLNAKNKIIPAELENLGYTMISKNRDDGRNAGGVALLIQKDIIVTSSKVYQSTNCDLLLTKIKHNNLSLSLLLVYRPPNNDYRSFITDFTDIIHIHSTENLLILGDFNFHVNTDLLHHYKFKMNYNELNLTQHVNFPTHIHGNTLNLILTFTDSKLLNKPPFRHTLLTDHYSIDFTITMPYTSPKRTTITYRNINKINYDDFKNYINKSVISCHLTAYSLTELLTDLLNKHAPLKTNYLTKHDNQPWFNSDLGKLKHIFRTQNKKYLKHPTIINRTQLQKSRYTYRILLNQTKTDYIKNKINHSQHDYKNLFNITKILLGKKNKISLPTTNLDKTLCTRFGDFFSEKVEKLCYNLDLQRQLLPTDTTILTTTCKHTFTEFE